MRQIVKSGLLLAICLLFFAAPLTVYAQEEQETQSENDIYDSLQKSIRENWDDGFAELEAEDEIEIKGPLSERLLRGIANAFYKHLVSIKAWSLFIGLISFVVGIFIAVTAKLNKKLRKFAISLFVITIPVLLIISVFGITKLISIFK